MSTPAFQYIPAGLLVPGFFFEVQPLNNTGLPPFQSLLIGQPTSNGSLGPTTVATSEATASGETLHFTSVPSNIVAGMQVLDLTNADTIAAGTTVTATSGTTVTISAAVTSGGPSSGDSIQFAFPPAPVLITSINQAKTLFGVGSMLALMCAAFIGNAPLGTMYALPVLDSPSGVAATASISIAGTVSQSAVLALYVCGVQVPVTVTAAMTNAEIATAIVAAVNANSNLPVTASGSSFPVTLTAKNLGLCGNDLDCRINYYGSKNQEFTPAGLTVTISAFTSGAENPSLTAPLASLGSIPFNLIAAPYVDAESYGSMETFLSDADGRWNYTEALYGHYFTVANNSAGSLQTLGTDINDQHITVMGIDSPPTPPFYIAAGLAGQAATSLQADPGQPLNTLILSGCLPPSQGDQWTISEQQTLLTAGIGTLVADTANNLRIGRPVTTYTTNSFGQPDNSYQNAEFMYCIMFTITYFAANLSSTYARCKLAADGTRVPTGSNIVTPSVIQGTLVNLYGNLCDLAICQNFTNFTQNVTVVIDPLNPNMVDCSLPATMISQLETTRLALQLVL